MGSQGGNKKMRQTYVKQTTKKILSLLIILSMCLSFMAPTTYAWAEDGTGEGNDASGMIAISSEEDLEKIRENPSGNFQLTDDIEMTKEFTPIDSFSGVLDGNGHTISNLTITASTSGPTQAALVVTNEGTIQKLGLYEVNLTGLNANNYFSAGIAANNYGTIEQCYVTGTINGGYRVGGITAENYGTIRNCYTRVDATAHCECGGIVAVMRANSVIEKCWTDSTAFTNNYNVGVLVAYSANAGGNNPVIQYNAVVGGSATLTTGDTYARICGKEKVVPTYVNNVASVNTLVQNSPVTDGTLDNKNGLTVTDAELKSEALYKETLGWDTETIWTIDNDYPSLKNVPEPGQGSEEVPVVMTEIATAADLDLIRENPSGNFKLTADIQLDGLFTPISSFSGILDGDGHTITGLMVAATGASNKAALIANNSGNIKNLGLAGMSIYSVRTDDNCWAAGIAATNTGSIENCYVTGSVEGGHRTAGIAAHNYGTVKNCYAVVTSKANGESAGLVAVSETRSTVENCYARADVYSSTYNAGGLVAYARDNTAVIKNSAVLSGSVEMSNTAKTTIGRILGKTNPNQSLSGNIASASLTLQGQVVSEENCGEDTVNGATVTDEALKAEAAYTDLGWDFSNTWAMDDTLGRPVLKNVPEIAAQSTAGETIYVETEADLAKIAEYPMANFVLKNNITVTEDYTPAEVFCGTLDGNGYTIENLAIQTSSSQKDIALIVNNVGTIKNLGLANVKLQGDTSSGSYHLAGLSVYNNGTIENCYVNGKIYGGWMAGGIACRNYSIIRNCYTQVSVRANWEAGAIVGVADHNGIIDNCYAIPNVYSYVQNTGGITGYGYADTYISDCALLAGNVSNVKGETIARIIGKVAGVFTNNIASENVLVNGAAITEGAEASNEQGATVTDEALTEETTYKDTLGWDFENTWTMDSQLGRPVLKNVAEIALNTSMEVYDVTFNVGSDETTRNFNWISTSGTTAFLQIALADAYENDGTFPTAEEGMKQYTADTSSTGMDEYANKAETGRLEENTTYVYRVGNEEAWSGVYTFETGDFGGAFSFLFAGDPQIGSSGDTKTDGNNWEKTLEYAVSQFKDSAFLLSA